MAEQVRRSSNRKTVPLNIPYYQHIPLRSHTLFPSELKKALGFGVWERLYRPVGLTRSILVIWLTRVDAKTTVLWGQVSNWALYPRFSCSYHVSGTWYIHNSTLKGKLLKGFFQFFVFFQIFKDDRIEFAYLNRHHVASSECRRKDFNYVELIFFLMCGNVDLFRIYIYIFLLRNM